MKRVLIVTETGPAWPSGQIRALSYKDLLVADGIKVEYVSRRVPWLTRPVEKPGRVASRLLDAAPGCALGYLNERLARAREAHIVRRARDGYDAIYLQEVRSWPLVSALRRASHSRLVYDLNDGVWLRADPAFANGRGRDILRTVDAVTCKNPYVLTSARPYHDQLFVVPDPPQVELFDRYRQKVTRSSSPVVLGWVGSPSTLFDLYSIWESLEALFERNEGITLRLVGTGYDRLLLPHFERVRFSVVPFYSQVDMVREVLRMHIGLVPLFDVEDSLMRGVLESTIYMSGEVCVVTRPIGQNRELISDGYNGVFASTASEWLDKLERLVKDADLRQQIARAGLQTVQEKFTLRRCYEQLLRALDGKGRGKGL